MSELQRQRDHYKEVSARLWQVKAPTPNPLRERVNIFSYSFSYPVNIPGKLRDVIPISKISVIKREVCRAFNIRRSELDSPRKESRLVRPRHLAIALARRLTSHSLPEIGRMFGGRDHTTVMHASRKMEPLLCSISLPESATISEWVLAAKTVMEKMG